MRYENVLQTVGRTPVVRLHALAPSHVELWVKLEAFNPMGSVKDRMAVAVIEAAEREGRLRPGDTVVEATSGNTGIALAMVCAQRGYRLVVVMAENFSVERRRLMRFLGAKVVLTPAAQKGSGMLAKAAELAERHGWFLARQFENEANADAHRRTTALEILEDFAEAPLDWWVSGSGTGGTLKGVGRVLRQRSPLTRVAVCEPENSPVLASGIAQPRNGDGTPNGSHPSFRPHPMQGWGPDFVPALTESALAEGLVDRIVRVNGAEALRLSRELARREGILTGITGGATLAGALQVAAEAPRGARVLAMLPDTGERYLSTPLFAEIGADMDEEELEIARSTPNFRFDAPTPPTKSAGGAPAAAAAPSPRSDVEAERRLGSLLADPAQPVVMFALEWCEFCWSLRRMFARLGIPCRSVDLDSVAYQKDDLGGRLRTALTARTGIATIPQVFVGGELVGGCTDTMDAWRSGRLQALLEGHTVPYARDATLDPYGFLPTWLHKR